MESLLHTLAPIVVALISLQWGHYVVSFWGFVHRKDLAQLHKNDAILGMMLFTGAYFVLVMTGSLGSPWLALPMAILGFVLSIWARKNHNAVRVYARAKMHLKRKLHGKAT